MDVCINETRADEFALDINLSNSIIESSEAFRLVLDICYLPIIHLDRVLPVQKLTLGRIDYGRVDQIERVMSLWYPWLYFELR